jgi:hypothetical protein
MCVCCVAALIKVTNPRPVFISVNELSTQKSDESSGAAAYLSDPRVAMPIGFLAAIPLLQHQVAVVCPPAADALRRCAALADALLPAQVYVVTEETQLLGCFMVFVGTIYSQFGDAIRKHFDSQTAVIMAYVHFSHC